MTQAGEWRYDYDAENRLIKAYLGRAIKRERNKAKTSSISHNINYTFFGAAIVRMLPLTLGYVHRQFI